MIFEVLSNPNCSLILKMAEEILLGPVTHVKTANPSCLMLDKLGKGNICRFLLRMYFFTVPEEILFEALV